MVATLSERLLIERRRAKLTQRKAAKLHGVGYKTYLDWELGRASDALPNRGSLLQPTPLEWCFLLRRRKRWSQKRAARKLCVTREWYNNMERGRVPATQLTGFWLNGVNSI
jgi:transcriptional regulator with XRE-family HTH domain